MAILAQFCKSFFPQKAATFYQPTQQTNGIGNDDRAGIVEVGDDLSAGDDPKGAQGLC